MSTPRVFVSYSHDSPEHKNWVLTLSSRLTSNGVNVVLDQWDLGLGGDLPHFMETGLTASDRVLVVCTPAYVTKANKGDGGVGYEKMILTSQMLKTITEARVIPLVRASDESTKKIPFFLGTKLYVDFQDDAAYEARYAELLRDIHGMQVSPRPPLGPNPFETPPPPVVNPRLEFSPERYTSPGLFGTITFDYSNNNGRFVVGAGDMTFETAWSRSGNHSIHTYNDPPSIRTVALAIGIEKIQDIVDATSYDTSSRAREPQLGEIVVWQNSAGYYLATKIEKVASRSHGFAQDELVFSYVIAPGKSTSFAKAP
ncbi:toll/interleukin-1 receptor domain-containing protein [Burkholderiaceae bacterium UC74_6]